MIRVGRLVVTMALVLLVGGCGGSSSSGLTKQQWIAKADGICKDAKTQIAAIPAPTSITGLVSEGQKALVITQNEFAQLRGLAAPSADAATIKTMLDTAAQEIPATVGLIAIAKTGDMTKIQQYEASKQPIIDKAKQLAKSYGLTVCGG
jgi:hypothetical protein